MKNTPFAASAPARQGLAAFQRGAAGVERDGAALSTSSLAPGLALSGTEGADSLAGSAFDDVIDARGGDDTLAGGAGNDTLLGGSGNDQLNGNAGSDMLDGGDGNDGLFSNYQEDDGSAPLAADTLIGGQGDDVLVGSGNSVLYGGAGNDQLMANGNGNVVDGGDGDDRISAALGSDTIIGGNGNDDIVVKASSSATPVLVVIDAGAGDDVFTLNTGTPTKSIEISGGSGREDYFFAYGIHTENIVITDFQTGIGGDQIELFSLPRSTNPFGAAGYLRLVQSGSDTLFQVDDDGAAGAASQFHTLATLRGVKASDFHAANIRGGSNPNGLEGGRYNVGNNAYNVIAGNEFDDTLFGGGGDDELYGKNGNDALYGGDGSDTLDGGMGSDTLDGGAGDNDMLGGNGDDQLTGGSGKDKLDGGWNNDQLYGADGDDTLLGGWGDDTLVGGNGNDSLSGDAGSDQLDGGAGDDILNGPGGNAQLNGGSGNDRLKLGAYGDNGMFGGTGNDVLDIYSETGRVVAMGGTGDDTIILHRNVVLATSVVTASGGAGVDTYQLLGKERTGSLTVKDFAAGAGGDRIDVSALLKTPLQLDALLASGLLRIEQSGTSTLVQMDTDGNAGAASAYTLMTLQNVVAVTITADNFLTGAAPVQLIGLAAEPVHAG